ncbi:GTP binding [Mycena chlorophos]|uniref:GTP binding n=1 Tax=Mycena chlorophos TaxID=658473 RepID=A0A8H6WML4_MYCCL|nr:GTP binding [Mycena chlorophos]
MTMGAPGSQGSIRNTDISECEAILKVFADYGHKEIDTARMYGGGSTEEYLGQIDLGVSTLDTKVYPVKPGDHRPENLRATFFASLKALNRKKVRVLYLHAPDRSVPFEETLEEMNKLHNEGYYEIFGLSNFASWEVAEVVSICKAKGWLQPKIYQAMYNAITRAIEPELVPCCRKFGIRLVIYNPLAGGLFAGKVTSVTDIPAEGRFNDTSASGKMYRDRFLREANFEALNVEKHDLRLTEVALRWCQHHSVLTPEDGVIVGASSAQQLKQNLEDSAKGPLPEDVIAINRVMSSALTDLGVRLVHLSASAEWSSVESTAQELANGLRIRDGPVDNHTPLGQTSLPRALQTLLTAALEGNTTPPPARIPAVFELLQGYAESIPNPPVSTPLPLTIPNLKVVRTAIGVLLNVSLNYDPVKSRLRSLDAALTIMKLSTAIYPTAAWLSATEATGEDLEEEWTIRSGVASWAWKTVVDLKEVKDETLQIFNPDILPLLTPVLAAFSSPYPTQSPSFPEDSEMFADLLLADFEALEQSCTLIESLSLDVEDVRLSLARGFNFPAEHGGIACLSNILDFIEKGDYPVFWQAAFPEADRLRRERVFNNCKAALIKTVVEVAGEERNEDVLWDDSETRPGGEFVCRMVDLIKKYVDDTEANASGMGSFAGRDDIVICASLSLGNLARREKNSSVLLSPPHSLAPYLTSPHLLAHSADIKMKHGVIGLLKHVAQSCAQSAAIHDALAKAEVVKRISTSGVWDEKVDAMADIVQLSAIGIVKYMCNANVENTFVLVLGDEPTGLSLIMSLVKRTESTPIRSEGTRVLVNVIKSLWSTDTAEAMAERQQKRNAAMQTVLTSECAFALASLVARSAKYPLLVNEGVVALSLMSTIKTGGPLALSAILTPIDSEPQLPESAPASASSEQPTSGSDLSSPVVTTPSTKGRPTIPRNALDMLIAVLRNVDNPANFQIEVRLNV